MYFKCILFYFWLFKLVTSDNSLTVVLDTTESMQEELDVIKVNLATAFNGFNNTDIRNFIIVPFNDPDVGDAIEVKTPRDLISAVNGFSVGGGRQCPENSLAGIERALQISKPQSYIFLFTDAYPKDVSKLNSVVNFCRNTRSQVVIFLSGYCLPSPSLPVVTDQVYYDIAKACDGVVVRLGPESFRKAFVIMKELINVKWTNVINYDSFTESKELTFAADAFTKTMLLIVSGENPQLQLRTSDGSSNGVENILNTRNTQVVRLTDSSSSEYTATIRCRGKTTVTLYKKYEMPLSFGFATKLPRSMAETSKKPIPGRMNYILIEMSSSNIKLETVEIQVVDEQTRKTLTLEETGTENLYITNTFIEPEKTFVIWIKGYDSSNYKEVRGSTENIIPQQTAGVDTRWLKPESKILEGESITVDFGRSAMVACKVRGYPAPSVVWEDDEGISMASETVLLEIPSIYISYASIENVTKNFTVYCKSKNSEGEDSQTLDVYVYRPYTFDVLQTPADQTIEYGSDGKLYCEVSAYPEADIKWYHNDSVIVSSDDVEIETELHALWIKNMSINNVGEYKCEITNEANTKTYSAYVSISGIEAPKVEVEKTEIILKLGDWNNMECRVLKGKPTPSLTWQYKTEDSLDFGVLPDGVIEEDGKLKIASAQTNHKGIYRCSAENIEGIDSADLSVQLQYPPLISNNESETIKVKEGEEVALPCVVDASPAARIRWEMLQDDVIIPLNERHTTDRRNTLRFKALWRDSGIYHCIAENGIGSAEKRTAVIVLVAPYIEAPKSETVYVRPGGDLVLMCNVLYGYPVPSTEWKFIALDSSTKVLSRHNFSSPLRLTNIGYADEGTYRCFADNGVGTDRIQINVKLN